MTAGEFPGGKRFAFTVFDDTDDSTVANSAPVYRLLAEHGIFTTKSVWVLPSRGGSAGQCLLDPDYREWICSLASEGFEIGLHNVGDGGFTRQEILDSLKLFNESLGHYPRVHANHISNPDCLYWWDRRFEWPFSLLYRAAYRARHGRRPALGGHDPSSPHFWGDAAKRHISYVRNLTFNDIDTLAADPRMPYSVGSKSTYSNLWFSSSDGQRVEEFIDLLSPRNLARLEERGGACVVYTHFASGFVGDTGEVDRRVAERIAALGQRPGWFVPVTVLLDHLVATHGADDPGYAYRLALDLRWGLDRVRKRIRYGR